MKRLINKILAWRDKRPSCTHDVNAHESLNQIAQTMEVFRKRMYEQAAAEGGVLLYAKVIYSPLNRLLEGESRHTSEDPRQ